VRRRIALWAPVALYMSVIFYLSSLPEAPLPAGISDKPTHSLAYMGLAVVMIRALTGGLPARITRTTAMWGVLLTIAYGVSDELHQTFVPGRSAELLDLCADAIGASIGAACCWAWGIISAKNGL
jgi:VanZ family protein